MNSLGVADKGPLYMYIKEIVGGGGNYPQIFTPQNEKNP